jgi:hypothetical protein
MQMSDRRRVVVYLAALVGREPAGLLEMRWRHDDGMRRRFYRAADELPAAAAAIIQHGARTDVYVGCAPRSRRAGGLDAIARAWVLWVDCDSPQAVAALARFTPPPSIVLRSGTGRAPPRLLDTHRSHQRRECDRRQSSHRECARRRRTAIEAFAQRCSSRFGTRRGRWPDRRWHGAR